MDEGGGEGGAEASEVWGHASYSNFIRLANNGCDARYLMLDAWCLMLDA